MKPITIDQQFETAVFTINTTEFKRLLDSEAFNPSWLVSTPSTNGKHFPMYWITLCYEIVLGNPEDWKEHIRPLISKRIEDIKIIKQLFEDYFHVNLEPLDFINPQYDLYNKAFITDKIKDVFEFPDNVTKNHSELDIQLFMAVERMDFIEAQRLIGLGANPDEEFKEYDKGEPDYNCFSWVEIERGFLCCELDWAWEAQTNYYIQDCNIADLYTWAAYEKMYKILTKNN